MSCQLGDIGWNAFYSAEHPVIRIEIATHSSRKFGTRDDALRDSRGYGHGVCLRSGLSCSHLAWIGFSFSLDVVLRFFSLLNAFACHSTICGDEEFIRSIITLISNLSRL